MTVTLVDLFWLVFRRRVRTWYVYLATSPIARLLSLSLQPDQQNGRIVSSSAAFLHPFPVCVHLLMFYDSFNHSCRSLKHDIDIELLPLACFGVFSFAPLAQSL